MANRARLCEGEKIPLKKRAGEAGMEQRQEKESGSSGSAPHRRWKLQPQPLRPFPRLPRSRDGHSRSRETSSRGPPDMARGRVNAAGRTQTAHSQMSCRPGRSTKTQRGPACKHQTLLKEPVCRLGRTVSPVPANGSHWDDWDGAGVHQGSTERRATAVILRLSPQQPSRCFSPGAQAATERDKTWFCPARV